MINFSSSSIKELTKQIKPNKIKKIFIISGSSSFKKSGAEQLLKQILINKQFFVFLKKEKYPELTELKKIIYNLEKFNPDLIVAIGGGSVLDYAKIANCIKINENIISQIINSKYKIKKKKPLLAIPTTAGSGAEVTSNAVIYINKIKYSFESKNLIPDNFLLIPELMLNLKKNLKSSSGFDAIAQSLESILSKKSDKLSINYAKKSLRLSLKNYLDYLEKPNLNNTFKMSLAANFAGEAISISKTIAPHAISYPFTSHFNINHGHAVSLTLNEFLKFNYKHMKYADCDFDLNQRFKIIFELTKTSNILELDQFLKAIKIKAGLENNFSKLNIDIKKKIPLILSGVNMMRLANNPINLKKKDLKDILLNK